MKIPEVTILRNGNKRNRLTVAANRITLKLKRDTTAEEEEHLKVFSMMVAQRTLPIFLRTMRGCFSQDLLSIEMLNTSRSLYSLYCFDELEQEGFSTDPVASDRAERKATHQGYGGGHGYGAYRSGAQILDENEDWWLLDI